MENMRLKFYQPVVTGTPGVQPYAPKREKSESTDSFRSVLQQHLEQNSSVSFSKHAVKRALEHNIPLNEDSLNRLQEGVRLAGEKNLGETLILVGGSAFVVNVKNNTVITAVDSSELKGNVFTNIDGTVII